MDDKSELQHLHRADTSLVISEARSSLIVRGSIDAKFLLARKPELVLRARVKLNGKWGLIDKTGRFVVDPFCCFIRDFSSGMAAFSDVPVRRSRRLYQRAIRDMGGRQDKPLECQSGWDYHQPGHWGFVNDKWSVVIPAEFKWVKDFSEDLAGVVHNGKWGFLSKDGSFAIQARFEAVGDFSQGLCLTKWDGKFGFIDHSGRFAVEPRFKYLWAFSEGLACAEIDKKYGFIDRAGEIVIPAVFDSADDFHGGLARAVFGGKSCFIDPKGSVIFQCSDEEEKLGDFCDDVARVSGRYRAPLSECSHGHPGCDGVCTDDPCSCPRASLVCELCSCDYGFYIDRTGKPIPMPEGLVGIGNFSEGFGLVGYRKSMHPVGSTAYRYGYIDNRGMVKIVPQFNSAGNFVEGVALVFTEEEEWRLTDKLGNFVNTPDSQETLHRIQGFTRKFGTEWGTEFGFADVLGGVVIEPIYLDQDFREGIARVYTTRGKWRLIHKLGIFVDTPESERSCRSRDDNDMVKEVLVRFKDDGQYGFADQLGNVVIEPKFTWVERFSNGMARFRIKVTHNDKWGFIDRTGEIAISPQFEDAENFEVVVL